MKKFLIRILEKTLYEVLDHYVVTRMMPLINKRFLNNKIFHQQMNACNATANYINKHLSSVPFFDSIDATRDFAVKQITLTGQHLEFGVLTGYSTNFLADRIKGTLHGFDSFKGLPDDWTPEHRKGAFARPEGWLPEVRDNVELHVGYYEDSLPGFAEKNRQPIAFMHIDCDLYSSTKTIFRVLGDLVVPGTIILFDEYFNAIYWQDHEIKAFHEFIREKNLGYEYLGYAGGNFCQAVVRITEQGKGQPGLGETPLSHY
ncbi:MAG: class I SAM-dependent methyltransferase [Magnetococcales bacterium]|nr:class I SAM-dependent methyltransferase [Magnetococcales bacterium]